MSESVFNLPRAGTEAGPVVLSEYPCVMCSCLLEPQSRECSSIAAPLCQLWGENVHHPQCCSEWLFLLLALHQPLDGNMLEIWVLGYCGV